MDYKSKIAVAGIGVAVLGLALKYDKKAPIESARTDMDVASILASGKPYPLSIEKKEETIYEIMAKGAGEQGFYFI